MTPLVEHSKSYDPVAEIKLRAATPEESQAARGSYLWKLVHLPWDISCKIMGTVQVIWAGPNLLNWQRPLLQTYVDRTWSWLGFKPEEKFMSSLRTYPFGNYNFITSSTKGLEAVFKHHRNEDLFINNLSMTRFYQFCQEVFPDDVLSKEDFMLTCSPEKTKEYRTLLHSLLQKKKLKEFCPKIYLTTQKTLNAWGKRSEAINVTEQTRLFTSSIITQLMFDGDSSSSEIAESIDFMNSFVIKNMMKKVTEEDKVKFKAALEIFRKAVEKILANENIPLFNKENELSVAQKKALIFTIFFSGQETTASLLTWIIRQLALSPDLQESLHQELLKTKEQFLPERLVNQSAIIKEVFNREIGNFPPAFGVGRKLAKDACIEYRLEGETKTRTKVLFAGDSVTLRLWQRAKEEIDSGKKDLNYRDWRPFGFGPHSCPGEDLAKMEIDIFLSELLLNYKMTTEQTGEINKIGSFTLKLSEDVRIKIEPWKN